MINKNYAEYLSLFLMETKLTVADNIQCNLRISEKICRLIIKIPHLEDIKNRFSRVVPYSYINLKKKFIFNFVLMGEK